MFEDEGEEDWLTPDYKEQLQLFEKMYASNQYHFIDSEHIEFILDHLIATNQMKKAKWAAEKALEHFPANSSILTRYAQILSSIGEVDASLTLLLNLERLEPNSTEIYISIATCYSQLKDSKRAIRYFNKAFVLSDGEEKIDIAIDLAMEYENSDDYPSAIKVLNETISEGNLNDLLVYELAHCYEKVDDFDNAIKCFKDYIDIEPYSYTTWYNLGNVYAKKQKYEEAIWAYDYAILINENFIPAIYNIANTYFDNNQIEKALQHFQMCLDLDQEDPLVYCSIGECYEELGDMEKAYEMFHKSTELFPALGEAWLGKGIMSDVLGFGERAIQELLVAVDIEPFKAEGWNALANAYESTKKPELALVAYEKAIELGGDDKDIIIDYLSFLTTLSIDHVYDAIENNQQIKDNNVVKLVLTFSFWMLDETLKSQLMFESLVDEDVAIAKDLFYYFPELETDTYFKNRIQELQENK